MKIAIGFKSDECRLDFVSDATTCWSTAG